MRCSLTYVCSFLLFFVCLTRCLESCQLKTEKQARELAEQRLTRRKLAYDTLNRRALAWKAKAQSAKIRARKYKRALKQALVCIISWDIYLFHRLDFDLFFARVALPFCVVPPQCMHVCVDIEHVLVLFSLVLWLSHLHQARSNIDTKSYFDQLSAIQGQFEATQGRVCLRLLAFAAALLCSYSCMTCCDRPCRSLDGSPHATLP